MYCRHLLTAVLYNFQLLLMWLNGIPSNHSFGNSFQPSEYDCPVTPDVIGLQYVPPIPRGATIIAVSNGYNVRMIFATITTYMALHDHMLLGRIITKRADSQSASLR